MTVLNNEVQTAPFVYSSTVEARLGDDVNFDLQPPVWETRQLHGIKVAVFDGPNGLLIPLHHRLWMHSLFQLISYATPILKAPLFRLADPQLYPENFPQDFTGAMRKIPYMILSQEPVKCAITTRADGTDRKAYAIMLIADMTRQRIIR